MSGADPFDDALDAAIDALQRGRPLDAVVADQGHSGALMRPLLEAADAARQSDNAPPLSLGLEHNYTIVRAAVERAQMAAAAIPGEPAAAPRARWWRRKLAFASLSLPAGALALALSIGAAGATASLVATDMGSRLGNLVSPIVPDAIDPSSHDSASKPGNGSAPAGANDGTGPGASENTPGSENGPTAVSVEGTVSDVSGNTFTLTNSDGEYHVQIDSNTAVDGEILEGATADVEGDLTAEKNLHATSVSAEGGTPADDRGKPDDTGQPDDTGKPEDPGQPGEPLGSGGSGDPPGQTGDPPGNEDGNNGIGGGPTKP